LVSSGWCSAQSSARPDALGHGAGSEELSIDGTILDNLEQLAGNVKPFSKAKRVRWRSQRRPSDSAGGWKIQVFDSLVDFREFYKDNDEWQEITDPAKMGLFVPAAKNSLEELDARSSRINPLNVRSFSIGSVFDRTPAVYLPNFLSLRLSR